MLTAHGLYGHIRNNDLKATALLAGFGLYVGLLWVAVCLFFSAIGFDLRVVAAQLQTGHQLGIPRWLFALHNATHMAVTYAWAPALLAVGWLVFAFLRKRELIEDATGAERTSRTLEPELYNAVETLAIGAGLPMPSVEIIETDALNAYASGWTPADSVVVVTRGLLRGLRRDELEAVLAHEITHIQLRDVRLMTVTGIFVGFLVSGGNLLGAGPGRARTRELAVRSSGGAGIILVVVAIVIAAIASVLSLLSEFALSRTREFVADAGAVALTKNPDALIRALQKISTNDEMPVPKNLRAMMISSRPDGWIATHPSIESRIAALETYAAGKRPVVERPPANLRRPGTATTSVAATPSGNKPVRSFGRRGLLPETPSGFGRARETSVST